MRPTLSLLAAALLGCGASACAVDSSPPRPCLTPGTWFAPAAERPRRLAGPDLLADMARRDVVLLGEHHDDPDHHRWQLQTLAALHAQRPDMAIGFEMFPRRVQPVLDKWVAGELTAKQFLDQTQWSEVWNMPAELYLPLFEFARLNRIPMLALNVERKLTEALADKGWDGVAPQMREGVSRPAPAAQQYREFLFGVYQEHLRIRGKDAAKADRNDAAFRNFVDSQTVWDRAMGEKLAQQVKPQSAQGRPLAVGIMGSGHIRHGHGVPHQLRDLGVSRIGTLLPASADDCSGIDRDLADAVFALPQPAAAKAPPPRLGVNLQQSGDKVMIAEVHGGSLAERTGFRKGDQLVAVAGTPTNRVMAVIEAIRRQPEGTWLPMQVRRGEETIDLVAKFPPRE